MIEERGERNRAGARTRERIGETKREGGIIVVEFVEERWPGTKRGNSRRV